MQRALRSKWAMIALLLVCACFAIFILFLYNALPKSDKLCDGIIIGDTMTGGMSRSDAYHIVEQQTMSFMNQPVTLQVGEKTHNSTIRDFGPGVDTIGIVDKAYNIGREGPIVFRIQESLRLRYRHNYEIVMPVKYDDGKIGQLISAIANSCEVLPSTAEIVIDRHGDRIIRKHGRNGQKLDVPDAMRLISSRLPDKVGGSQNDKIRIIIPVVTVPHDERIRKSPPNTVGEYTTTYHSSSKGRALNVELAAKHINDSILRPGEEFSFNRVVGPRDYTHGFKDAPVISGGRLVEGVGGGVCQVSSTLYNAVLDAGLLVTSRRPHSKQVDYVPKGRDATVVYGNIDFRFRNTAEYPICLEAITENRELTIRIRKAQF